MQAMPHVAALAALLRDGGVRASPAGAAVALDAALTTCSGLQAAAVDPRLHPRSRKLAGHAARLLNEALVPPGGSAPPTLPAAAAERRAGAAAAGAGAAHPAALEAAERRMLERTAAALAPRPVMAEGGAALDRLLIAAAESPAIDRLTGQPGSLAAAAAEALAVELQRPVSELRLSQRGWAACFTLRPAALHAALGAVLKSLAPGAAAPAARERAPPGAPLRDPGELGLLRDHAVWGQHWPRSPPSRRYTSPRAPC